MKGTTVRDSFCVRFLAPKRADHETKRYRLFHLVVRGFVVQKLAVLLVPHHRPVGLDSFDEASPPQINSCPYSGRNAGSRAKVGWFRTNVIAHSLSR